MAAGVAIKDRINTLGDTTVQHCDARHQTPGHCLINQKFRLFLLLPIRLVGRVAPVFGVSNGKIHRRQILQSILETVAREWRPVKT